MSPIPQGHNSRTRRVIASYQMALTLVRAAAMNKSGRSLVKGVLCPSQGRHPRIRRVTAYYQMAQTLVRAPATKSKGRWRVKGVLCSQSPKDPACDRLIPDGADPRGSICKEQKRQVACYRGILSPISEAQPKDPACGRPMPDCADSCESTCNEYRRDR